MQIMTILKIVVCFQRRHKGVIQGFDSSVCSSRGCKQEQYWSRPDSIERHCKTLLSMPSSRIMMRFS